LSAGNSFGGLTHDDIFTCDINNFRFHDLRHSCASYLVQAKVPLLNVAHHLGQKDYNSVLRYAHLAEDVTEETGSIVADRIYGNQ